MNTQRPADWTLLLVDGQNDFRDVPRAALPVPGATADLMRSCGVIRRYSNSIGRIVVTLDSQPHVAIERVSFWVRGDGGPVLPFTQVTLEQVDAGEILPRDRTHLPWVRRYLATLSRHGRKHTIWPVHCVIGTWGHLLYEPLAREIAHWEERTQHQALKVLKGLNPLTEQFSAVKAEVPRADDPRTHWNYSLIEACRPSPSGYLLVAGEAASHCVADTVRDITEDFSPEEMRGVVLLTDCMSSIPGCEAATQRFFADMSARGAQLLKSTQLDSLLLAE